MEIRKTQEIDWEEKKLISLITKLNRERAGRGYLERMFHAVLMKIREWGVTVVLKKDIKTSKIGRREKNNIPRKSFSNRAISESKSISFKNETNQQGFRSAAVTMKQSSSPQNVELQRNSEKAGTNNDVTTLKKSTSTGGCTQESFSIKRAFNRLSDKCPRIDIDTFIEKLDEEDVVRGLSDSQFEELFSKFDKNGDGFIDQGEFSHTYFNNRVKSVYRDDTLNQVENLVHRLGDRGAAIFKALADTPENLAARKRLDALEKGVAKQVRALFISTRKGKCSAVKYLEIVARLVTLYPPELPLNAKDSDDKRVDNKSQSLVIAVDEHVIKIQQSLDKSYGTFLLASHRSKLREDSGIRKWNRTSIIADTMMTNGGAPAIKLFRLRNRFDNKELKESEYRELLRYLILFEAMPDMKRLPKTTVTRRRRKYSDATSSGDGLENLKKDLNRFKLKQGIMELLRSINAVVAAVKLRPVIAGLTANYLVEPQQQWAKEDLMLQIVEGRREITWWRYLIQNRRRNVSVDWKMRS